ncbi:MAG: hypothetical protein MUF42_14560 [Cytophagaceae bacterium]|nr:hypothetical protein [Cytophagaceae bacterium]
MKSNYRIQKNPQELSPEQIDKHKNFNQLLRQYEQVHRYETLTRPIYRKAGIVSLLILAGVVILLLWLDKPEATLPIQKQPSSNSSQEEISTSPDKLEVSSPVLPSDQPSVPGKQQIILSPSATESWTTVLSFLPAQGLVAQLSPSWRVLIEPNAVKLPHGLKADKDSVWFCWKRGDDSVSSTTTAVRGQWELREAKTKKILSLQKAAIFEYSAPMEKVEALMIQSSEPNSKPSVIRFESLLYFTIQTHIPAYLPHMHHVWEIPLKQEQELMAFQSLLRKEWRSIEPDELGFTLARERESVSIPICLARMQAADSEWDRMRTACWNSASAKYISSQASSVGFWKHSLPMRMHVRTVRMRCDYAGTILLTYTGTRSAGNLRILSLVEYPQRSQHADKQSDQPY